MSADELRVADLMTRKVHTLTDTQSLPLAESLMGLARIRHVPVVDEGGRLVGLVTHRDLLAAKISGLTPLSPEERSTLELSVPVSKVMRTDVWTIAPDALAVSAARILKDHRFGCLPVVEEDRRLVGIVTEADLLRLVTDALALDRPKAWTVERAMTHVPVTIGSEATVAEARDRMTRFGIRHLPVLEDGRVVAMLSDRDLRVAEAVFRETEHASAVRTVRLVGHDELLRVAHDAPLDRVFREMFDRRIDAAVVEKAGRLVGVLTASDACRLLASPPGPFGSGPPPAV